MELPVIINPSDIYTGIGLLVFFMIALYSRYQTWEKKVDFMGALFLSACWPLLFIMIPTVLLSFLYKKIARMRF
ncbi:hypothetical protein [Providencia hangzhouensis]|uniref:hypothetical protein n=1 Tax=Providencia hangzhouensis TaxID=3031799 RepID=UPI0034DD1F53